MPEAEVELFKQIVKSGHPKAAAEFWSEHFVFSLVPLAKTPGEAAFQRMLRNDCREMVRWLKTDFGAKFPSDKKPAANQEYYIQIAEDVLAGIVAEATSKYQMQTTFSERKAEYREAALHALDDPDGALFFAAIEGRDSPGLPADGFDED